MKTALVLGGADCLFSDIEAYTGEFDGVVACNDAGVVWEGELTAWVTLHPEHMIRQQEGHPVGDWLAKRREKKLPDPKHFVCHERANKRNAKGFKKVPHEIYPGQPGGSSGLFAAKVALFDLNFDRVVFCGVPLTRTPHFYGGQPWLAAEGTRPNWRKIPDETKACMRSMSGWTRDFFGYPEWIE